VARETGKPRSKLNSKSTELKVGLVVLLGCAILILGLIWFKGFSFQQHRYNYSVIFPNIGSLEVGDPVAVSGVRKGRVEKISLYQGDVLVEFNLSRDVVLKKDAKFTVMNIGLMGERFIAVETGHSDTLLNLSQPATGYYDVGIPEVMGRMSDLIDAVRRLTEHLESVIGTESSQEALIQTIENVRTISQRIDTLLEHNQSKLNQTVSDLSQTSHDLKEMLGSNKDKIQSTVDNFSSASGKLDNITTTLDSLSLYLKSITSRIESGDGSLGQLLNDTTLYEQMKKTTLNVDSLILDIKKHPRKYLKISIF
jgi:phospholipid/cholesterol/gamma-HCH transport system substrate-binding protein